VAKSKGTTIKIELKNVPSASKASAGRLKKKILAAIDSELPEVAGQGGCTYYFKTYFKID
jgi:hypothetical protein